MGDTARPYIPLFLLHSLDQHFTFPALIIQQATRASDFLAPSYTRVLTQVFCTITCFENPMFARFKGSLVDPNRPTHANWLRSNPGLVGFNNGASPHSSAGTTVSSVFSNRATGSTISTVGSLHRDNFDLNETSTNESRFSTITIDDVSPATTSSRQQYTRPWEAIVLKILRKKIQDAIVERNEIRGSNLAVRLRKNFKADEQNAERVSLPTPTAHRILPPVLSLSSQYDSKAEPLQQVPGPDTILEASNAAASQEFGLSHTLTQVRCSTPPTPPTVTISPQRYHRRSDSHSISTMQSITSEEERKRKPCGEEISVYTDYPSKKAVQLFALLASASHKSWVSLKALKDLGVADGVGKDDMGVQPLGDNGRETRTMAGAVKAYGKIKLSCRFTTGPRSAKRHKAWFYVADHPDTPFDVLLGQDFPGLWEAIRDFNLVTLAHPKSKEQKAADAARAKKAEERRKRLQAEKASKGDNAAGSSDTEDLPDPPNDASSPSGSGGNSANS